MEKGAEIYLQTVTTAVPSAATFLLLSYSRCQITTHHTTCHMTASEYTSGTCSHLHGFGIGCGISPNSDVKSSRHRMQLLLPRLFSVVSALCCKTKLDLVCH